jgi:hypothetical protein
MNWIKLVIIASVLSFFQIGYAWAAAGSVVMDYSGDLGGVCGDFVVSWQAQVTEDNEPNEAGPEPSCLFPSALSLKSPYLWEYIGWTAHYARLCVEVDGNLKYCDSITSLNTISSSGYPVSAGSFAPGTTHTIRVYLEDIYGVQCNHYSGYDSMMPVTGSVFGGDSVSFTICSNDDPCCCDPNCGNSCPYAGADSQGAMQSFVGNH